MMRWRRQAIRVSAKELVANARMVSLPELRFEYLLNRSTPCILALRSLLRIPLGSQDRNLVERLQLSQSVWLYWRDTQCIHTSVSSYECVGLLRSDTAVIVVLAWCWRCRNNGSEGRKCAGDSGDLHLGSMELSGGCEKATVVRA